MAGKLPAPHPGSPASSMLKTVPKGLLKATLDFLQVLSLPRSFTTLRRFWLDVSPQDSGQRLGNQARASGRNLEEICLHELTWQGWSNHNLCALTQGRYMSINFARSIKEASFISFLLQHVREHKLDLDQIAECFRADSGIQVASSMAENAKAKKLSG